MQPAFKPQTGKGYTICVNRELPGTHRRDIERAYALAAPRNWRVEKSPFQIEIAVQRLEIDENVIKGKVSPITCKGRRGVTGLYTPVTFQPRDGRVDVISVTALHSPSPNESRHQFIFPGRRLAWLAWPGFEPSTLRPFMV